MRRRRDVANSARMLHAQVFHGVAEPMNTLNTAGAALDG